ncbi:EMP2 protein, partial [Polyodon spathula]|nr:EMP2 protein [Polyodon spathula]
MKKGKGIRYQGLVLWVSPRRRLLDWGTPDRLRSFQPGHWQCQDSLHQGNTFLSLFGQQHPAIPERVLCFTNRVHEVARAKSKLQTHLDQAWWTLGEISVDLWQRCNGTDPCIATDAKNYEGFVQTVQASMILSTILCCVGFFVFILQLFRLKQGERFVFTAIIQLLSSLCVMTGASIYTAEHLNFHSDLKDGQYGSSFILAWLAFPFTLFSGLMYLVLRKRK